LTHIVIVSHFLVHLAYSNTMILLITFILLQRLASI